MSEMMIADKLYLAIRLLWDSTTESVCSLIVVDTLIEFIELIEIELFPAKLKKQVFNITQYLFNLVKFICYLLFEGIVIIFKGIHGCGFYFVDIICTVMQ